QNLVAGLDQAYPAAGVFGELRGPPATESNNAADMLVKHARDWERSGRTEQAQLLRRILERLVEAKLSIRLRPDSTLATRMPTLLALSKARRPTPTPNKRSCQDCVGGPTTPPRSTGWRSPIVPTSASISTARKSMRPGNQAPATR